MSTSIPIYMVNAFTTEYKFSGNPAAVIIQQACDKNTGKPDETGEFVHISEQDKQKIATELNLSETSFVSDARNISQKSVVESDHFQVQWFTPTVEVDLCGHATLATAAALYHAGNTCETLRFTTLSGELATRRSQTTGQITLDFPLNPARPIKEDELENVNALVKLVVGDMKTKCVEFSPNTGKLVIQLDGSNHTGEDVGSLTRPDMVEMLRLANDLSGSDKIRGIIVTVEGGRKAETFTSRYFAPWVGIPEDPVTGSAHTVLADYWYHRLGMQRMLAHQASPRGGHLHLLCKTDGRVEISGDSQIVYNGIYYL